MSYANLSQCIADLESSGRLRRVSELEIDPHLELAAVQRRACRLGGPALLFTRLKGCAFPALANLFGDRERTRYIFRSSLRAVEALLKVKADPLAALKRPWRVAAAPLAAWRMLPKKVRSGPLLARSARLSDLPKLVSWPMDGGPYVTLPQVYSEAPGAGGFFASNLGMYRVQTGGNDYLPDKEAGLHYQIHRGIGPHHLAALQGGGDLPVNVFVGGPPALTLAAIMPLPEAVPEICFAGALAGRRIAMIMPSKENGLTLPAPAEADFCIAGRLRCQGGAPLLKKEGPFGDHLGYYSLAHDFPVLEVEAVFHREDAVWPFTSVGRPPQEDTVFGDFIHELTAALVPTVFSGLREVHAVDAAGVHPLLLAVGSERYVPFAAERMPQELLTNGFCLLGSTQTSLSKYLLIAAHEDAPSLSTRDVPGFFSHMLRRTDFRRDLHFITRSTMDTLDYSGISLNQGSKLLWAAAGAPRRELATSISADLTLPAAFSGARLFAPGILLLKGPVHNAPRDSQDQAVAGLAEHLGAALRQVDAGGGASANSAGSGKESGSGRSQSRAQIALAVLVDDPDFVGACWENFLWVVFTRSDPASDLYGAGEFTCCKHWGCDAPLVIDARAKAHHAPALEEDPDLQKRIDQWGAPGGPLHGLV